MRTHELDAQLPGLASLRTRSLGHPEVRVAILDGPVDVEHEALASARIDTLQLQGRIDPQDRLAMHGTHVASVIVAGEDGPLEGIAPHVTLIAVPVFSKDRPHVPQVDLARAIEAAISTGAHVINLSAGQYADAATAHDLLAAAVKRAQDAGILLVAAAGNDACDCLHVPAALPTALAVGALDRDGEPADFSNWGAAYLENGILAPGQDILGAAAGGGRVRASGTSAAAPIVSAVAALLLSVQREAGQVPDPLAVRRALLLSAHPCPNPDSTACRRSLAGILNIEGALAIMSDDLAHPHPATPTATDALAAPSCGASTSMNHSQATTPATHVSLPSIPAAASPSSPQASAAPAAPARDAGVSVLSTHDEPGLVYALGSLGYDFGTEARRDSFKQLMAPAIFDSIAVPANPHDPRQMVRHLEENPSEAQSLIWTVDLELTPLYALEATGPYAADIFNLLCKLYAGQIAAPGTDEYVERVSIPGVLTDRNVRLFSGQVVPVVQLTSSRGMFGWRSNLLVKTAVQHVSHGREGVDTEGVARALVGFLDKVYYEYRNLGVLSRDRALNFAATNAFQAAVAFADALAMGMELDMIDVEPSPYARMDADAWDVKLKFFDPENLRRARRVFRFTVDVSETMPVTMGEVRSWSTSM